MINFENTYRDLPHNFYASATPLKAPEPKLIAFNADLARDLGVDADSLGHQELAEIFTGQTMPPGAQPIALAYAGHQFGNFVPQLGDGRALLMGEVVAPNKERYDIQLKGSGRTVFSRGGDGKSSLGPVIREYIVSEAMAALGVPTTRALAACETGEQVLREAPLPGGILTRVASSHIRIGTFEFFSCRDDVAGLKRLADYAIDRHFPYLRETSGAKNIYVSFIEEVARAQAKMVARWMSLGFIHGVMNTDNMSISGETIDYGPCAFMDNFSKKRVFSSIDRYGRYAYGNQITIAKWNLSVFASALIPLIDENSDKAISILGESIDAYIDVYDKEWLSMMVKKLGIQEARPEDEQLVNAWLAYLEEEDMDFTLSFRNLTTPSYKFNKTPLFDKFFELWKARGDHDFELMNSVNPILIPRNHQVERAIQDALKGDYGHFKKMNKALKNPFVDQPEFSELKAPPRPEERISATFCGT